MKANKKQLRSMIRKAQFSPRVWKFRKIREKTKENARKTKKTLRSRRSKFLISYFFVRFLDILMRRKKYHVVISGKNQEMSRQFSGSLRDNFREMFEEPTSSKEKKPYGGVRLIVGLKCFKKGRETRRREKFRKTSPRNLQDCIFYFFFGIRKTSEKKNCPDN